ncbi:MAG: aminopeptidase [Thermoanaerobaculia bacterium]
MAAAVPSRTTDRPCRAALGCSSTAARSARRARSGDAAGARRAAPPGRASARLRRRGALPVGKAFSQYVDLDRPYAVWNVVAAPELSVEPITWCFPVAGCVTYRGYFSEQGARRFATRLEEEGLDVAVQGVSAYSTLGWFADPVLSTFVSYPEPDLAALLFHELAHREVYVRDDTTFNESFATAVEEEGLRRWLQAVGGAADEMETYQDRIAAEGELARRVLACRQRLAELYASPVSDEDKRAGKARLLAELSAGADDPELGPWGAWLAGPLDNADLASIGEYRSLVPSFRRLLAENAGDLPSFYAAVGELARLPAQRRQQRLAAEGPAGTEDEE